MRPIAIARARGGGLDARRWRLAESQQEPEPTRPALRRRAIHRLVASAVAPVLGLVLPAVRVDVHLVVTPPAHGLLRLVRGPALENAGERDAGRRRGEPE